jgi:hypothetical protein
MSKSQNYLLEVDAERALFEGKVHGLAVAFYQNERPPRGLSGVLDWYFQGAISQYIRSGAISGKIGECTYFPCHRNGSTYHIILAGAGIASRPGKRDPLPEDTFKTLHKNLASLGIEKIGISKSDFGNIPPDSLVRQLKGVPLWIAL